MPFSGEEVNQEEVNACSTKYYLNNRNRQIDKFVATVALFLCFSRMSPQMSNRIYKTQTAQTFDL